MTLADIIQSQQGGDSTQATFMNALSVAMVNAGFNAPTILSTSPTLSYIWQYDTDTGDTYQNLIIGAGFTAANTFETFGYASFSGTAGTNQSTTVPSMTLTLTDNFNFYAINHPEIRGVVVSQAGVEVAFVGYLRPLTTPSFWNENQYPFAFIPKAMNPFWFGLCQGNLNSTIAGLQPISSLRPTGITSGQFVGGFTNAAPNPANANSRNTRVTAIVDANGQGASTFSSVVPSFFDICDFSPDVQAGSSYGMIFLDYITNGSESYTFIDGNASQTFSRIFVRTE
jgi:hypothetical protein